MKKVFFLCMTAGLLASSCDWFKSKPAQTDIADTTVVTEDSTLTTNNESSAQKADSAVAETKTEKKKEANN